VAGLAYRTLNRTVRVCNTRAGAAVWGRAWEASWRHWSGPVTARIHGHRVLVNAGYPYPMLMRRWPTYNDPLVEIVAQARGVLGRPVTVVDVGAAIGDTALLLLERAEDAVGTIHCVEGDAEFFGLLQHNLADIAEVRLHRAMLSDLPGTEKSLQRTHRGTASAVGPAESAAVTLDELLAGTPALDVLKTDTDGFDGKVLAGAVELLAVHHPAVIFEWHPKLYQATGNDWMRPFSVLDANGYDRYVWFSKFGELSHTQHGADPRGVDSLAAICLGDTGPTLDWHYDIVALHATSPVRADDVAALREARARRGGRPRP
jgi:FkbM family methyltransferase